MLSISTLYPAARPGTFRLASDIDLGERPARRPCPGPTTRRTPLSIIAEANEESVPPPIRARAVREASPYPLSLFCTASGAGSGNCSFSLRDWGASSMEGVAACPLAHLVPPENTMVAVQYVYPSADDPAELMGRVTWIDVHLASCSLEQLIVGVCNYEQLDADEFRRVNCCLVDVSGTSYMLLGECNAGTMMAPLATLHADPRSIVFRS